MTISKENFFPKRYKGGKTLYFDKDGKWRACWKHKTGTKIFPFHESILKFLEDNPNYTIYFTLDPEVEIFKLLNENEFLVNMRSYIDFCDRIGSKRIERAHAFFSSALNINEVFTDDSRDDYVTVNSNEKTIIEALKRLDPVTQKRILEYLTKLLNNDGKTECQEIGFDQTLIFEKISALSTNAKAQILFFNEISKYQIETLKQLVKFLKDNLDKKETFIQNWIDEDDGKYRKQRCLIFGLEYVDPKREGRTSQKKFDILADQSRESHILIELKSPSAEVFKVTDRENENGGRVCDYQLSNELSRAIPQILEYRELYKNATANELEAMGIEKRKTISKCIIVIGQRVENQVWKEHFDRLQESIGIEIMTYTDLIDKLENTIINLSEHAKAIK